MPGLLAAADLLEEAATIVIAGPADQTGSFLATALAAPDPAIVVIRAADTASLPPQHPAFGKQTDTATAYICRRNVCGLPITDPAVLRVSLRARSP